MKAGRNGGLQRKHVRLHVCQTFDRSTLILKFSDLENDVILIYLLFTAEPTFGIYIKGVQ